MSTLPSLTRRATCRINSRCGIVSKYFDKSASMISVFPCLTASTIPSMAWCARRFIHRLLPLAPRGATVDDVFGREPPNSTGRTFTCVSARFAGCCARTPKLRFAVAAALCRRRGGAAS
ncbi:MAG: hypothetical protein WCP06_11100, partial [Verrucomicrobiota bacterium]